MSIFNKSTSDHEAYHEAVDGIANRHYWLQLTGLQDIRNIEVNYGETPVAAAVTPSVTEVISPTVTPSAESPRMPEGLRIGERAVERSEQQEALERARAAIDQIHDGEGADSHEYGLAA